VSCTRLEPTALTFQDLRGLFLDDARDFSGALGFPRKTTQRLPAPTDLRSGAAGAACGGNQFVDQGRGYCRNVLSRGGSQSFAMRQPAAAQWLCSRALSHPVGRTEVPEPAGPNDLMRPCWARPPAPFFYWFAINLIVPAGRFPRRRNDRHHRAAPRGGAVASASPWPFSNPAASANWDCPR